LPIKKGETQPNPVMNGPQRKRRGAREERNGCELAASTVTATVAQFLFLQSKRARHGKVSEECDSKRKKKGRKKEVKGERKQEKERRCGRNLSN